MRKREQKHIRYFSMTKYAYECYCTNIISKHGFNHKHIIIYMTTLKGSYKQLEFATSCTNSCTTPRSRSKIDENIDVNKNTVL